MRKNLKGTAAIILSLVMTGMILTGCGGGSQPKQDTSQEISTEGSQEDGKEPEAKAEEETMEKQEEESIETKEEEPAQETADKAEGSTDTAQAGTVYEDNFEVDSEAAKEFALQIKEAAAQKDLEALAALTAFPVYVGLPDVDVVETKEAFLELGAEAVFTDGLLESVEAADIDNFQPSMAGFSISDGGSANINFGVVDGVLAINGINY